MHQTLRSQSLVLLNWNLGMRKRGFGIMKFYECSQITHMGSNTGESTSYRVKGVLSLSRLSVCVGQQKDIEKKGLWRLTWAAIPSMKCQDGKHSETFSSFPIHCYSAQPLSNALLLLHKKRWICPRASLSLPPLFTLNFVLEHLTPPVLCTVQGQRPSLNHLGTTIMWDRSAPPWYLTSDFELEKMCPYPALFNWFILTFAGNQVWSQSQHTKGWL